MFSVVHHSAPINRPREGFLTCAEATHRLVRLGSFPRLCTKSGKSDLFSLRPLRISAALCVERPINAENAEIRRGRRGKTSISTRLFVQSLMVRLCLKTLLCHKKAQRLKIDSADFLSFFVPLCG